MKSHRGQAKAPDRSAGVVSVEWFPKPKPAAHGSRLGTLLRMGVGAVAAGVLYQLGHVKLAVAAGAITLLVGGVSLASTAAQAAIARALAWFGRTVGSVVGNVLLTIVYVFALTPAHYIKRLSGTDDLRLRNEKLPSYYERCDNPERKIRHARDMFATEVLQPKRGSFITWLIAAVVLLTLAEGILRSQGFGPGAVLYVSDPYAGYYPAPNQYLDRYGGLVQTNAFGMRAPDYKETKEPGTFRILMLGDSTLWGGSYVDQKALYARILEDKLNQLAGGKAVQVLNMGVNGWGPFHERGFIDRFGSLDADLVLICLPHDDVDRDRYTLSSLPYFVQGKPPVLGLEEVFMHSVWRYRRDRITVTKEWRAEQREIGIAEYERLGVYLRDGDSGGSGIAIKPRTKVGGSEVLFEILPSKTVGFFNQQGGEVEADVINKLKQRLTDRGFQIDYPTGLFAGKGKGEDLYHDEVHLHVAGHAVYADYLLERVSNTSKRFGAWLAARKGNTQ